MGASKRSMNQFCQGEFDPTSDKPYFLYFQKVYTGDYFKYQKRKLLSLTKRSSDVFKLTTRLKPLCLRYVVAQCSQCREYFSVFNTTKHYKTWETSDTPKISRKLLEKKGVMMCTDCIWVQEGMDEVAKTPPNSPGERASSSLVNFDKFKSFADKMIQELTRPKTRPNPTSSIKLDKPKPFVSLLDLVMSDPTFEKTCLTKPLTTKAYTTCGVESTPFSKRIQKD